jgi:alkylation response protein AidB-like acyl-CoA dehydrogenase
MDFRLSEDQQALQSGIRSFCDGRVPFEALAELEQKRAFDRDLWRELAEMGVFSLRLSEEEGGVGLGHADAVIVFAELGRRLVPGPLVWTHLAAGLIEGAAEGDAVVGGVDAITDPPGSGPLVVEHLESLDALLVLRKEGVFRVDPRSLEAEALPEPLDPLTPVHHVGALPEGERVGDADLAARLWRGGALLTSALCLGICEATLEEANDYAKKREQFGRPIGGFQAVKHLLSDMFVRQEVARASAYAAGATLDHPEVGDPGRVVATAKLLAGQNAVRNARGCIQVYGGMGYTWEMPPHWYWKRAWVHGQVFGRAADHEETVASTLG